MNLGNLHTTKFSPLRLFTLLVGVFVWTGGLSQTKENQPPVSYSNQILWPYLQTVQTIDSLEQAHPITYWTKLNKFGMEFNEVTFQNWSAGGSNAISLLFNVHLKRTFEKDNLRWQNEVITLYGINSEKGRKLRKTEDQLEVISTFGYRSGKNSNWFYSAKVNFKTQLDRGYDYPNRELPKSRFMAPGYLFSGFGAELGKDSDKFTLYLSPATAKTTYVFDRRLADRGDFGVRPAEYDALGNITKRGSTSKTEFGILITNEYNAEVFENVNLSHRISLYSDYLDSFGNIDIDWKLDLSFRVNHYIAAKIGSHLIFNDDTKVIKIDEFGQEVTGGAKIQWKQNLGIGIIVEI